MAGRQVSLPQLPGIDLSELPEIPDLAHHHKIIVQPCSQCGRRWVVLDDEAGFVPEEPGTATPCCVEMLKRLRGLSE